jgi:hypothetical protein
MHPHDRTAYPETRNAFAFFRNDSGIFMAERSGHRDKRVPPQKCLEVGPAGERGLYLYQQFSCSRDRARSVTDLDAPRFFQDGGTHGSEFQLAAEQLAEDRRQNKEGDIPEIEAGIDPRDDDERDGQMDVKEPLYGVFSGPCPEIAEKNIQHYGKDNDADDGQCPR